MQLTGPAPPPYPTDFPQNRGGSLGGPNDAVLCTTWALMLLVAIFLAYCASGVDLGKTGFAQHACASTSLLQ